MADDDVTALASGRGRWMKAQHHRAATSVDIKINSCVRINALRGHGSCLRDVSLVGSAMGLWV